MLSAADRLAVEAVIVCTPNAHHVPVTLELADEVDVVFAESDRLRRALVRIRCCPGQGGRDLATREETIKARSRSRDIRKESPLMVIVYSAPMGSGYTL